MRLSRQNKTRTGRYQINIPDQTRSDRLKQQRLFQADYSRSDKTRYIRLDGPEQIRPEESRLDQAI